MGCATREGKLAQHCDVSPVVHIEDCVGCGECQKVCPAGAINLQNKKSAITKSKCIGCASCIAACPTMAMFIDFGGGDKVQEKMVEYAFGAVKDKSGKVGFINFIVDVSPNCDCYAFNGPPVVHDIGVLASLDPVAIDQASVDLVNQAAGRNVFKEIYPAVDWQTQLAYAEKIGLGSRSHELVVK